MFVDGMQSTQPGQNGHAQPYCTGAGIPNIDGAVKDP
jgi:hypothetical protein